MNASQEDLQLIIDWLRRVAEEPKKIQKGDLVAARIKLSMIQAKLSHPQNPKPVLHECRAIGLIQLEEVDPTIEPWVLEPVSAHGKVDHLILRPE